MRGEQRSEGRGEKERRGGYTGWKENGEARGEKNRRGKGGVEGGRRTEKRGNM